MVLHELLARCQGHTTIFVHVSCFSLLQQVPGIGKDLQGEERGDREWEGREGAGVSEEGGWSE